jgi:thioesterase domain-containing protein
VKSYVDAKSRLDNTPMEPDELELFPLAPNQKRFWILDQLEPGNAAYHIPICLRLIGPLSRESLERSLAAMVARHEPLRSRFVVHNSEPMLVVDSRAVVDLQVLELSAVRESEVEAKAYSLVREEIGRPFDLSRGPPIRTVLLILAPAHHILVCTIHHIASDGWSAELLVREIAEHYEALTAGREPSIEPLAFPYSSYAVLQHLALDGERMNQQLSYWRRMLADAPPLLDLRPRGNRPDRPTHRGASHAVRLDGEMIEELQQLAREQRSTLFMVLTAAFGALVSLFSQRTDIVIGIPVTGRDRVETESLIGLFVNTIVLRVSLAGDPSFEEILDQTRGRLLDAMSHQDVPFERVVDAIGGYRSPAYNPIFQIMFSMFRAAVQSRRFGPLSAMPYIVESSTARVDLNVNVIQGMEHTWWLQAEYRTDLFDHSYISNILAAYLALLRMVARDADKHLSKIGVTLNATLQKHGNPQLSDANGGDPVAQRGPESSVTGGIQRFDRSVRTAAEAGEHAPDYIERTMITIWGKALRRPSIQIDDDFFNLGGHSLMAISLTAEINRTFRAKFPVSMLLRESTIRRFARRLRSQTFVSSSFVALSNSGHKSPLFVVGNNYRIRELADALGPDQPLYQIDAYALQEERIISGEPLVSTIQDFAIHFVSQIVAVQNSGPYFLAGQCEGAIIAIEIANELKRLGHKVATLMLFDTPVTGFLRNPAWHRRFLIALERGDLPRRLVSSLERRIRAFWAPRRPLLTEDQIWVAIWAAVRAYGTNHVFDGAIVLFRATEMPTITADPAVGWERVGTLKVIDIPGDHSRLFTNREAQAIIKNELDNLQARFLECQTS